MSWSGAFEIVVACDQKRGIGKEAKLPWHLPGDMKFFRELTSEVSRAGNSNAVIMGRKTWQSIPEKRRPLKDRINIVMTTSDILELPVGVIKAKSIGDALRQLPDQQVERVFVIGGATIYKLAMDDSSCQTLHLTQIMSDFDCDTFLPEYDDKFTLKITSPSQNDNGIEYYFKTYQRRV